MTLVGAVSKRTASAQVPMDNEEQSTAILVGAVSNRTASAQLEIAPTEHGERKCLFIFMIHHNLQRLIRSCY